MERIAEKITFYATDKKIDASDLEFRTIKFAIQLILDEGSKFAMYGIIFAMFNMFPEYLFSLAVLCPLRLIAGGYHTKTYWGCFLLTFLSFFFAIYIGSCVPMGMEVKALMFIIGIITIITLAPVDHPNMPVRNPVLIKKKKMQAIILFSILGAGSVIVNHYIAGIASLILFVQALTLPAGIISNKIRLPAD